MDSSLSLYIFVRHVICQPLRRAYEIKTTLPPWFCGNTEALSVRGVRRSALLVRRLLSWRVLHMLLYHYPYSLPLSRFYSHISAVYWALGVLSIQLFFQCSTQAGKNDAPCSQQKENGCRIIGSVSVSTPIYPSVTRREAGVLDAKTPLRPSVTLTTGIC